MPLNKKKRNHLIQRLFGDIFSGGIFDAMVIGNTENRIIYQKCNELCKMNFKIKNKINKNKMSLIPMS